MENTKADYDTYSVHLARIIGNVRTYLDLIEAISNKPKNAFWNVVVDVLYSQIVIESYKLIDKDRKVVSLSSINRIICKLHTNKKDEIDQDLMKIKKFQNNEFCIHKHRNSRIGHLNINNAPYYRLINFEELGSFLQFAENIIKKYNKWEKGDKYSIDFSSIFAEGHSSLIKYVNSIDSKN